MASESINIVLGIHPIPDRISDTRYARDWRGLPNCSRDTWLEYFKHSTNPKVISIDNYVMKTNTPERVKKKLSFHFIVLPMAPAGPAAADREDRLPW